MLIEPKIWAGRKKSVIKVKELESTPVLTVVPEKMDTREKVESLLKEGFWLANYGFGKIGIFYPSPHGGLCQYIFGDLAEELGKKYDSWNYGVDQKWLADYKKDPHSVYPSVRVEIEEYLVNKGHKL